MGLVLHILLKRLLGHILCQSDNINSGSLQVLLIVLVEDFQQSICPDAVPVDRPGVWNRGAVVWLHLALTLAAVPHTNTPAQPSSWRCCHHHRSSAADKMIA
jgi:hypothetical protein